MAGENGKGDDWGEAAHIWSKCGRKRQHKTSGKAMASIVRLRANGGDKGRMLVPYRCRYCENWHIGKPSGSESHKESRVD